MASMRQISRWVGSAAALLLLTCEGGRGFVSYARPTLHEPAGQSIRDHTVALGVGHEVELLLHPSPFDGGTTTVVDIAVSDPAVIQAEPVGAATVRVRGLAAGHADLRLVDDNDEDYVIEVETRPVAAVHITPVQAVFVPREHWAGDPVALVGAPLLLGLEYHDDQGRPLSGSGVSLVLQGRTDASIDATTVEGFAAVRCGQEPVTVVAGDDQAALSVRTVERAAVAELAVFVDAHGLRLHGERLALSTYEHVRLAVLPRTADGGTVIAHADGVRTTVDDEAELVVWREAAPVCALESLPGCDMEWITVEAGRAEGTTPVTIETLGRSMTLEVVVAASGE